VSDVEADEWCSCQPLLFHQIDARVYSLYISFT
jgi:hypothetical protein